MSGRQIAYYTAVHVVYPRGKAEWRHLACNDLAFRTLSEDEIAGYLRDNPDYGDYALGFNPLRGLVWRFRSPHHSCSESEMRTSEPKPH